MGVKNIAVFGLGFVGLTTALGFAEKGFSVRGFDIDAARNAEIAGGSVPFFEPGLGEALARNGGTTFCVSPDAESAVVGADLCFFCVGTPGLPDGGADLTYLFAAIDSVVGIIPENCVLVIKSTIAPGTLTGHVRPRVRAKGANNPIAVNPEFLREGKCWEDFIAPDRIVCGTDDGAAETALAELYAPFGAPVRFVSPGTAEFIKFLSNSLLATLISYSNEMAFLAESVGGIDAGGAFRVLHEDRRLAGAGINTYIYPGCGYGGYCLPKDAVALRALARAAGFEPRILDGVIALNDEMAELTARKIERAADGNKNAKLGVLGLSFKPGSDDVRDSPAARIIAALISDGYADVMAYDPVATENFRRAYDFGVAYGASAREVCERCGTVAVVTAWDEFRGIDKAFPDVRFVDCRYFLGD
jgi:UDPglucose 6-dehydrogenase